MNRVQKASGRAAAINSEPSSGLSHRPSHTRLPKRTYENSPLEPAVIAIPRHAPPKAQE